MRNFVPWVNVATGILAIVSSWVLAMPSAGAAWDIRITGLVILIVALVVFATRDRMPNYWPAVNIVAGIWLVASTGFVGSDTAAVWSNVELGVVTFVAAIVSLAYERGELRRPIRG